MCTMSPPLGAAKRLRGCGGFTLIEIAVTLAVLGFLLRVGLPAFSAMLHNAQVRTVGDSLQNGLRLARSEALRTNRQVVFSLTNAVPSISSTAVANGAYWAAVVIAAAGETTGNQFAQGGKLSDVANGVSITGPAAVCFNSNGRLTANSSTGQPGATCAAPSASVTYAIAHPSGSRALSVQVSFGGRVRMCDPTRTQSIATPDGC